MLSSECQITQPIQSHTSSFVVAATSNATSSPGHHLPTPGNRYGNICIDRIPLEDGELVSKFPIFFEIIHYKDEAEEIWATEHNEYFNIVAYVETDQDLMASLPELVSALHEVIESHWEEYALKEDDQLTSEAIRLKRRLMKQFSFEGFEDEA